MFPLRALLWLSAMSAASADFVTGQLGDARENLNNPVGAAYYAALPPSAPIEGSILVSTDEGQGANFEVNFANLPSAGGPFLYHIHEYPVPPDGNCTGTLSHLDPYIRGESPPCDPTEPQTCQVGDLSGKHGTINGTSASLSYHDPYVSLQEGLAAFFGNRSFVVHFANTTRIACANFSYIGEAGRPGNVTVYNNSTSMSDGPKSVVTLTNNVATTTMSSVKSTSTGATAAPATVKTNGGEGLVTAASRVWALPLLLSLLACIL